MTETTEYYWNHFMICFTTDSNVIFRHPWNQFLKKIGTTMLIQCLCIVERIMYKQYWTLSALLPWNMSEAPSYYTGVKPF